MIPNKSLFFIGMVVLVTSVWQPCSAVAATAIDDFVLTVQTANPGTSSTTQFIIPTTGSGYTYDVDWDDDGTWDVTGATGDVTCNYGAPGVYTVRIRGTFPRVFFNNAGDCEKVLSVEQWGTGVWTSMEDAFNGCVNMAVNAMDAPDLSNVTSLCNMFRSAEVFNQDIGNWDTSNVMDMSYMFCNAYAFNGDISNWNTINVQNMRSMFYGANAFNQDIGNWNTGNVTNMIAMFRYAYAFNQDIGNWNTTQVSSMSGMFWDATSFNQDIGNWNTVNVTNMSSMFRGATAFDQNIGNWNVTKLSTAATMFESAGLSSANYDALLVGWNAQALLSNVTLDGGNSVYSGAAAVAAHDNMTSLTGFNWTITDGGYVAPTPTFTATASLTPTTTPTPTVTGTGTVTSTISPTGTISPTQTVSPTVTATPVHSATPTNTVTPTSTVTPSITLTVTTTTIVTLSPTSTEISVVPGKDKILIYPSPAKGKELWFYYYVPEDTTRVSISIYNVIGEHCITLTGQPATGYNRTRWDIANVAPGIYFCQVKMESAQGTKTFPVQKLVVVD